MKQYVGSGFNKICLTLAKIVAKPKEKRTVTQYMDFNPDGFILALFMNL
jgi:hypothetical protein